MSNIVVDDTDASLTYSGYWNIYTGSSRQWESTIHSTFQYGATVSFQFRGSVCKVYGTVPQGNGSTILIDVTIDGFVSPVILRTSGSAADYANLFYQSSAMQSVWHTVIITNRGGAGNLDFEFDRVELDANDIVPTVTPLSPASTSAGASQTSHSGTSSTLPNLTSLNPTGANTLSGASSSSQPSKALTQPTSNSAHTSTVPVGTVIGIVVGIFALLILLLLFLCHRRRKVKNHRFALMGLSGGDNNMSQNPTTVATPFTLGPSSSLSTDLNVTLDSPSRLPLFSAVSEKALRQQTRANRSENDPEAASNATALPVSVPSAHATGSISDVEALTLKLPSSEPNRADANNDVVAYRYTSGSTSVAGPSTSANGGIIESMNDVPPAYQPNE